MIKPETFSPRFKDCDPPAAAGGDEVLLQWMLAVTRELDTSANAWYPPLEIPILWFFGET